MEQEDLRQFVATLHNLVQQMEKILRDYCRLLTAHDDGHWLERENDEPF